MNDLKRLVTVYRNLIDLSSMSNETIEQAILKLVEETGELASCHLKESNPEHMAEEASDIIQAAFKLAFIIQKQYPEVDLISKLLEKNEKWRKTYSRTR